MSTPPTTTPPTPRPTNTPPALGPTSTQPALGPATTQPALGPTTAQPALGPTTPTPREDPQRPTAPWLLRAAAGWSWRILTIAAAVYLVLLLITELRILALALIGALLTTALIHPLFRRLHGFGLGRGPAAGLTVLTLVLGATAVMTFLSATTVAQLPELRATVGTGLTQIREWLVTGPLRLDAERIERLNDTVVTQLQENRARLATGALSGATLLLEMLGGAVLGLFATFFFLYDGPGLWGWVTRLFAPTARGAVAGAGGVAWQTLTGYIRGTVLVALVDAVFIGLGLLVVGVPLVAPLAVLTFFGAFIPIAGATLAGIAAVLVALVSKGFVAALVITGVVLVVQQVEGHVLQPLVLGKSTRLHPLAIVLSITAGATLAGVPGAVVAVPVVAVLNRVVVHLASLRRHGHDAAAGDTERDAGTLADSHDTVPRRSVP